jgi:hypothetical protein
VSGCARCGGLEIIIRGLEVDAALFQQHRHAVAEYPPGDQGENSILFTLAGTPRVQTFFIAANNCLWPSDFYAWEKIYLFDRN